MSPALARALAAHQAGNLDEAEHFYRQVLASDKKQFDALHMLAMLQSQRGKFEDAAGLFLKATRINPRHAPCQFNHGNVLLLLRQYEGAIACYDQALAIEPNYAEAHFNRGNAQLKRGRFAAAIADYDRALGINPEYADVYCNRGQALHALKRYDEALAAFDRALAFRPGDADFHVNRGNVLCEVRRYDDALTSLDKAIRLRPHDAVVWYNRGNVLNELGRLEDALASFDRALQLKPGDIEFYHNRGRILHRLGRLHDELANYDRAITQRPHDAELFHSRGNVLSELGRLDEALAAYNKARSYNAKIDYLEGARLYTKLLLCDWHDIDAEITRLRAHLLAGQLAASPFLMLAISESPAEQLRCARAFAADKYPESPLAAIAAAPRRHDERIRVAYVSSDLRNHAIGHLTAGLFEHHDRTRFEITAISIGADEDSDQRRRMIAAFEHFIDAKGQDERQNATLIRGLGIDIAVDLNGYTIGGRPNIFAHRAAPVQVNYLGFPGTLGADYYDYIVADRMLIPAPERQFYAEQVVWLPHSYQANDNRRPIAVNAPSRAACGLPNTGFVFCSFNNVFKTLPATFDIWMRLLAATEGSVLWLLEGNAAVTANLRYAAEQRGVAPDRLVFAPRVSLTEHLARQRLADLFLDTLPYNAHTTASDALWAGLPIVTCRGTSFAGRVASSLLTSAGLPELIVDSPGDYEALALALARDSARLASLKHRLEAGRGTCPLFDTSRFTRHLETAYAEMWRRHRAGEPPASFAVDPDAGIS